MYDQVYILLLRCYIFLALVSFSQKIDIFTLHFLTIFFLGFQDRLKSSKTVTDKVTLVKKNKDESSIEAVNLS